MADAIRMQCGGCGRTLKLRPDYAGKKIRCPDCQEVLQVPLSGSSDAFAAPREESPSPKSSARRSTGNRPRRRTAPQADPQPENLWDQDFGNDYGEDYAEDPFAGHDDADSDNPYAAPVSGYGGASGRGRSGDIEIEGKLIRCGASAVLPRVCIYSGETRGLVEISKTLKHSPPWAYLIGGVLLMWLTQKKCDITWYVSETEKKKRTRLTIIGVCLLLLAFLLMIGGGAADLPILIIPGLLAIVAGIILLSIGQSGLQPVKRDGDHTFWLKGAKPPFLERVQRR